MRRKSFKILYDVFFNKVLLNAAVSEIFDKDTLSDVDKAFIKKETAGVIEKIDEIDSIIDRYSKVKVKKLNRDILIVLRLAIYEMLYMDKVPAYATINEYVNIIKKSKSAKYSSYVNAVLRNIGRAMPDKESVEAPIVSKNCYFRVFNDKEKSILEELKTENKKCECYSGDLTFKHAKVYKVDKYKDIIDTQNFKDGNVLIEDASSIYMTDRLADIICGHKEISILDTCSAPGGKILGLIDLLKSSVDHIHAVACDINKDKVSKIIENIERLIPDTTNKSPINIETKVQDATVTNPDFKNAFDLVICDVPCTGLGVIDKKPDIKLNYSDKKRDELVKIQRKILDVSKQYVKDGAYLAYSTCTETKEENISNVQWFLSANKDFKLIYEKQIMRNDKNNCDGFYMAIMKYEH